MGSSDRPQILIFGTILVENFQKIINALNEYGIDTTDLKAVIFNPQKKVFACSATGFQNGIFTAHSWYKMISMESKSFVLGYDDLIRNKETVKRAIDLTDVEELRKRRKNSED